MIKFYEVKDKHYSCVCKQWSSGKIHYIIEDFESNATRNVDIRQLIGDLVYDNLCTMLIYVKDLNPADYLRVVEAHSICREKLIPLCEEHRYNLPRLRAGLKEYENELRDLAMDTKSKIYRSEWNEGLEYIDKLLDYWKKEELKLKG